MKLLTSYKSGDAGNGGSGLARLLAGDTASTPAPKRAPLLIRLPYYIFLVALVAIYYGYVVSLNIRWLVIQEGRPGLSFIFLAIFHVLFGLVMWCLLATVYRGPGAVGETLTHDARQDYGDIESGDRTSEAQPLMREDGAAGDSSNSAIGTQATATVGGKPPRWRRRGSSRSHSSAEGDEERQEQDYLELQPKLDLGDDDSSDEDEAATSSGRKKPIEIVYSGALGASSLTAKANGKARYCRKCNVAKPDRAHHCSTCGFCVLKMDHHCPWIGGCVGFKNYKTFILFLFYGDLLAIFVCATSLWAVIQVLDTDLESLGLAPVGWGFLVLFGFLFAIMLIGFFPYHLYLSINNRSTIENMERNGRLLSLPTRAESMLAAGVPDPEIASLPERPKPGAGQHLLPMHMDGNAPQPGFAEFPSSSRGSSNPFLPAQSLNTLGSAASYMQATLAGGRQSRDAYASNTLDRKARRELERKSGRINIYDLGSASANFREAFGADWNSPLAWMPIGKSAGTGYEWPVNKANFDRLQRINEQLRGAPQGV